MSTEEPTFIVEDGIIHVWYEPGPYDEDSHEDGAYIPMGDPYRELAIMQFERAEVSERIHQLLMCLNQIETTDISTQVGSAVPLSQSKDPVPPGQSSD